MMPAWLMSAVRTAVQAGWGSAAGWLIAHHVPVPADAPGWVTPLALAAAVGAWTAVVRWLETRPPQRWWGRLARRVARLLMLGIRVQPTGYAVRSASGVPQVAIPAWMVGRQ
jgi:hypothetical protein